MSSIARGRLGLDMILGEVGENVSACSDASEAYQQDNPNSS